MRRLGAFVVCLALAASLVPALADHETGDFVDEGQILLPDLSTFVFVIGVGVTDRLAPCDPSSALQGLDGWWIALPDGAAGHDAILSPGETSTDVNGYFYDSACQPINDFGMATPFNQGLDESGIVPEGAAFALVNLYGASSPDGTFTYRVLGAGD